MEFSPESQHNAPSDCREEKKKDRREKPRPGQAAVTGGRAEMKTCGHPCQWGARSRATWSLEPVALSSCGVLPPCREPPTLVARRVRGNDNVVSFRAAKKAGEWGWRGEQNVGDSLDSGGGSGCLTDEGSPRGSTGRVDGSGGADQSWRPPRSDWPSLSGW